MRGMLEILAAWKIESSLGKRFRDWSGQVCVYITHAHHSIQREFQTKTVFLQKGDGWFNFR